jgi:hypothetical protein
MSGPFSVNQSRIASADASLRGEIRQRTGSEAATSGILRSIERFGADPSIQFYQVSPRTRNSYSGRSTGSVSWTVRAVRY